MFVCETDEDCSLYGSDPIESICVEGIWRNHCICYNFGSDEPVSCLTEQMHNVVSQ